MKIKNLCFWCKPDKRDTVLQTNYTLSSIQFNKGDFIFCLLIAIVCGMFFGHADLLVTAQRSTFLIKDSHIWSNLAHFYSNSTLLTGGQGANYLPSTFLIFAIWNIPLRIFGLISYDWGDFGILFTIWNKALPITIFVICGILVYKICKDDFGFSHDKAKVVMFLFITNPIAFFSQFIFCQYDIFTVFFMLLGIYYFFKKNRTPSHYRKFVIFFGISLTFKYFSALIFLVLLFLDTKKINRIIRSCLFMLIPAVIEISFYMIFDRSQFMSQVFEFSALDFATQAGETNSFNFNVLYLLLGVLVSYAYLKRNSNKNEKFKSFIFFSCGICTILFSVMSWHPQWLMFGVIFWNFALCINRNFHILALLDIINIYALYGYITKSFINNVDQNLIRFGILSDTMRYRVPLSESSVMGKYYLLDVRTLFTIFVCILIFYFVCSHRKYQFHNIKRELFGIKFIGYLRFLCAVLFFVLPASLSVYNMFQQPEKVWGGYITQYPDCIENLDISGKSVEQEVVILSDDISTIYLYSCYDVKPDKNTYLKMLILDENRHPISACRLEKEDIVNNGFSVFNFGLQKVERKKKYYIRVLTNSKTSLYISAINYLDGKVTVDTDAQSRYHDTEVVYYDTKVQKRKSLYMMIYS